MADAYERLILNVAEVRGVYDQILNIRQTCAQLTVATRNPAWGVVSDEVIKIQDSFTAEVVSVSRTIALEATRLIKLALHNKLVRPPTGNRPGLQDLIYSVAISTGSFEFGVVEVAVLSELDKAINPLGGRTPYWRTQEFGSTHNVGREILGSFYGGQGASAPSPLEFRQHPLFMPGGFSGAAVGKGTIMRPIPAKHFLRDGTDAAKTMWKALIRDAVAKAVSQVNAISLP